MDGQQNGKALPAYFSGCLFHTSRLISSFSTNQGEHLMKIRRTCLFLLCLFLASTGSAFAFPNAAQGVYPLKSDILLYQNFVSELDLLGIEILKSDVYANWSNDESAKPFFTHIYKPAEGVHFAILYTDGQAVHYSLFLESNGAEQPEEQLTSALLAFSFTFFDTMLSDAYLTLITLIETLEENENGDFQSSLTRDNAKLLYTVGDDYASLSYIP